MSLSREVCLNRDSFQFISVQNSFPEKSLKGLTSLTLFRTPTPETYRGLLKTEEVTDDAIAKGIDDINFPISFLLP